MQLQHLLDRVPFVSGEPAVDTRGRLLGTLFLFPDMLSFESPGPTGSALRVTGSHIHPSMCG